MVNSLDPPMKTLWKHSCIPEYHDNPLDTPLFSSMPWKTSGSAPDLQHAMETSRSAPAFQHAMENPLDQPLSSSMPWKPLDQPLPSSMPWETLCISPCCTASLLSTLRSLTFGAWRPACWTSSRLVEQAPSITRRWPNVALMLDQRQRRWHNIKTALGQRLLFAGRSLDWRPLRPTWTSALIQTAINFSLAGIFQRRILCGPW